MILNRTLGYGYEHGYLQLRLKLSPKLSRDRHLVRVFPRKINLYWNSIYLIIRLCMPAQSYWPCILESVLVSCVP